MILLYSNIILFPYRGSSQQLNTQKIYYITMDGMKRTTPIISSTTTYISHTTIIFCSKKKIHTITYVRVGEINPTTLRATIKRSPFTQSIYAPEPCYHPSPTLQVVKASLKEALRGHTANHGCEITSQKNEEVCESVQRRKPRLWKMSPRMKLRNT